MLDGDGEAVGHDQPPAEPLGQSLDVRLERRLVACTGPAGSSGSSAPARRCHVSGRTDSAASVATADGVMYAAPPTTPWASVSARNVARRRAERTPRPCTAPRPGKRFASGSFSSLPAGLVVAARLRRTARGSGVAGRAYECRAAAGASRRRSRAPAARRRPSWHLQSRPRAGVDDHARRPSASTPSA